MSGLRLVNNLPEKNASIPAILQIFPFNLSGPHSFELFYFWFNVQLLLFSAKLEL